MSLFNNKSIKSFFKNTKDCISKIEISSILFIFIISLYSTFALNFSLWRFILERIEIFESFNLFMFFISSLFLIFTLTFLIFNLITVPYITKIIAILLLLISSISNYCMYAYKVFIDIDMIRNVFETNKREALDLLNLKSFIWIFITGIIPSVTVFFIKIRYSPFFKEIKIRLLSVLSSILITGLFTVTFYKEYASFLRNNREVRKLVNTINYSYSLFRYFQSQFQTKREFIKIDENAKFLAHKGKDKDNKTVFILVIGEAARSASFSLYGYEKDTNPLLSKKDIVVFKNTTSCATSTAVSLPCIFSMKNKRDFNVTDEKYRENLVDLLHKTGYDVVWFENDDGCKGVCSRIENYNMVGQNNKNYCFGDYCIDEVLLDGLEKRIKNIDKNTVIVLHTMGSHGPSYYKRYRKEFEKFKPVCETTDIQSCDKEAIVNTYDNTIIYTDFILSSVIDILKKFPNLRTGMFYVSDHGESLGENHIYLHGVPYAVAPKEQKEIPMVLWLSDSMKKQDYIDYECLKNNGNNNLFSHDNVFHSIISLLRIKTTIYNKDLDIFRNCRTSSLE